MGRAERVVDEEVAPLRELARELGVVLRLARVEARVLEHLDPLVRKERAQVLAHGLDPERGILALRPAEVRADADRGSRRARAAARASAARHGCACRRRPCRPRAGRSGRRGRARPCRRRPRRGRSAAASFGRGELLEELEQVARRVAEIGDAAAPLRLVLRAPARRARAGARPPRRRRRPRARCSVESPGRRAARRPHPARRARRSRSSLRPCANDA